MSFASRPLHEGWTFTQVGGVGRGGHRARGEAREDLEEWRGGGNEPVENTGKKLRRKADGEPAAETIRTRLPGPP